MKIIIQTILLLSIVVPTISMAAKLSTPGNGGINYGLSTKSYVFSWSKVSNATNYRIRISQDIEFKGFKDMSLATRQISCTPSCVTDTTTNSWYYAKPDFKVQPGITFWQVRAGSSFAESSDWSSPVFSYTALSSLARGYDTPQNSDHRLR